VNSGNRLSSILRNHIYKEDHILFETADQIFSAEDDSPAYDRLNRFETSADKQELEKRLEGLRQLEWKYLRK